VSAHQWDSHYRGLVEPVSYGDLESYYAAADWLDGCQTVEDWGCGGGYFRHFVKGSYLGIDGSESPFADLVADLRTYPSTRPDGIVLRHVLEHDHDWAMILDNALDSFVRRLFVALFTPLADETRVLMTEPAYGDVPVIAFRLTDLTDRFPEDVTWTNETIEAPGSAYGVETLIRIAR
jgi:hypothetical protein